MIINNAPNAKRIDVSVAAVSIICIRFAISFFVIMTWQIVAKAIWNTSIVAIKTFFVIDTIAIVQLIGMIVCDGPFAGTAIIRMAIE